MKYLFGLIIIASLFFSAQLPAHAAGLDGSIMQGFNLEKIEHGNKVCSIKADKAIFGSKRIAFFNISLIKVINLEGVVFTTYSNGELVDTQHFDKAEFELNSGRLLDNRGNVIFRE